MPIFGTHTVGDYIQRHDHIQARAGKPISPGTKSHVLRRRGRSSATARSGNGSRRFDPARALAVPRSVWVLIGTSPRVIADEVCPAGLIYPL
jgi:hypothetical protein